MKKIVLVTGASSGIGKQLALDLEHNGHSVFSTYFESGAQSEIKGVQIRYNAKEDALDLDQLPETLDGLVYCPGSITLSPFHRIKSEAFIEDYKLQVLGAVNSLQQCYPKLKAAENPSVVLFSTVAVQNGFNFHSKSSI